MKRPVPAEIQYTPENITDSLLTRYAEGGSFDDPEMHDLLRICYYEAENSAAQYRGDARAYFSECAAILKGMSIEICGKAPEPLANLLGEQKNWWQFWR